MQIAVWDTYVKRNDGRIMHFDIIVPSDIKDSAVIFAFGREYLREKGEDDGVLTANECSFCHVESVRPQWIDAFGQKGYHIYEMENCD